jgi:hypothetical protein
MANFLDQFKHYSGTVGKSLMAEMVPGMAAGLITEQFHKWNINLARITSDIQNNRSLWAGLEEEQKRQLAFAAKRIGSLDFITVDWFIDAIKKDFPDIASLLVNWSMGSQWLKRQIEGIKTEIETLNKEISPLQ